MQIIQHGGAWLILAKHNLKRGLETHCIIVEFFLGQNITQKLSCTCVRCENVPECEELLPKAAHAGGSGALPKHLSSGGAHGVVEGWALAKRRRGTKCRRTTEGRWAPKHRGAAEPPCGETTLAFCLISKHRQRFCSGRPPWYKRWALRADPSWVHTV